jgi:hypothetical protein
MFIPPLAVLQVGKIERGGWKSGKMTVINAIDGCTLWLSD